MAPEIFIRRLGFSPPELIVISDPLPVVEARKNTIINAFKISFKDAKQLSGHDSYIDIVLEIATKGMERKTFGRKSTSRF